MVLAIHYFCPLLLVLESTVVLATHYFCAPLLVFEATVLSLRDDFLMMSLECRKAVAIFSSDQTSQIVLAAKIGANSMKVKR